MEYTSYSLKNTYGKMKAFGSEKLKQMRENRIKECEKKLKQLGHTFSASTIQATFGGNEKERDWAIEGGMASGAGGIGAGIATAIDVQQANAEIRQRNARRDAQAREIRGYAQEALSDVTEKYIQEIEMLQRQAAQEARYRYCIGFPTEFLFGMLEIQIDAFKNDSSYQLAQRMGVAQEFPPMIDIKAKYQGGRIDGYLKVTIDREGEYIMPLPYGGVGMEPITITIDTQQVERDVYNHITQIVPLVLWTVEENVTNNNYTAQKVEDVSASTDYPRFLKEWKSVGGYIKFDVPAEKKVKKKVDVGEIQAMAVIFAVLFLIVFFIAFVVTLVNNQSASAEFVFGTAALWAAGISAVLTPIVGKLLK